jgi:hypothetical protein
LLLKHIYGLSDEGVCERWVYDPYFQHFTGEEFFQHDFPHERSDLSHWRKRLGSKLELLLAESLRVAHATGALRTRDIKRVTVDTTVQPKAITFPTDAKLLHAAIKGLDRLARKCGLQLRQSYLRIAKRAAMMAGRYAHAKQFQRHHRQMRLLVALVISGFLIIPGPALVHSAKNLLGRVAAGRGEEFVGLAGATIRNVSRGIIGIAILQGLLVGIGLLLAGRVVQLFGSAARSNSNRAVGRLSSIKNMELVCDADNSGNSIHALHGRPLRSPCEQKLDGKGSGESEQD